MAAAEKHWRVAAATLTGALNKIDLRKCTFPDTYIARQTETERKRKARQKRRPESQKIIYDFDCSVFCRCHASV